MKGLSARNLVYIQTFAATYPDYEFTQQVAAQIPSHNQVILDKIPDAQVREWYLKKTIEKGWSRNVMVMQIEGQLHEREWKAQTNFAQVLPAQSSGLAQHLFETLKEEKPEED